MTHSGAGQGCPSPAEGHPRTTGSHPPKVEGLQGESDLALEWAEALKLQARLEDLNVCGL